MHGLSTHKPLAALSKAAARQDRRRDAILAVAREVFNERGFADASMSVIAARLGGSKGTLYNYFPSKEALFEAHVRATCAQFALGLLDFPSDRPVDEVLTRFGETYLAHLTEDRAVRMFQIVVAEADRSPELAKVFYEAGPAVGLSRLEAYLEEAKARGRIAPPDCALAASQFFSLCRGQHHLPLVLNLTRRPTRKAIAYQIAGAVEMFLARYGVQPPLQPAIAPPAAGDGATAGSRRSGR